jgi:hypothetical protein
MFKKLKAIYLIPVFLVLAIGLAVAGYYLFIVKQMQATKKAQTDWAAARDEMKKSCDGWQAALDQERTDAQKFREGYYAFHAIQDTMPDLYDYKAYFALKYKGMDEKEQKRAILRDMYRMMGTPKLANELYRWARKYHVNGVPQFKFTDGPMGYDDIVSSVQMVEQDFGPQKLYAHGYPALIEMVRRRTGYGFCPLIIAFDGGKIDITVDRDNPKSTVKAPIVSTTITAKGYFMTRAWDPAGETDAVKGMLDEAEKLLAGEAAKAPPLRTSFDVPAATDPLYQDYMQYQWKPCPPVLWVIQAKDVTL